MKVGFRKRSYKKSWSAMTSGRYKRMMKRAINPFYGRKGMGFLKNPSKALRGAVYRRTTIGLAPSDINRALRSSRKGSASSSLKNDALRKRSVAVSHTKKDSAKVIELLKSEREKIEAQGRMASKRHLSSNARAGYRNSIEGDGVDSYSPTGDSIKIPSIKKKRSGFWVVAVCLLLLFVLWSIGEVTTNRQDNTSENTYDDSLYSQDSDSAANNSTVERIDENSSKISEDAPSAESSSDVDYTDDNLVEGSKYDPECKRAISAKYSIDIRGIHYTGTQSEDKISNAGKYKMTSTLNYGKTYKGRSNWVCYLFVHTDDRITTVIYDL